MHRYVRVGALSAAAGLADDDGHSATVSHGRSLFQQLPFGGERAKAVLGGNVSSLVDYRGIRAYAICIAESKFCRV